MSKPVSKTLIGGFVVGAMILCIAGVLIFGSGKFLETRDRYVMYFEGSVKGLSVGAPVVLRGVKVGSVKDIRLHYNPQDGSVKIPVIVELEPERIAKLRGGEVPSLQERRKNLRMLVERGLRAQLGVQSLVTGQLMIQVDFHPEEPLQVVGGESDYPEIPTVPSNMEELQRTVDNVIESLRKVPLEELSQSILQTVEGINQLVNSPDMTASIRSLHLALEEMRGFVARLDREITPVASSLEKTLAEARQLVHHADSKIDPTVAGIDKTTEAAREALEAAEELMVSLESIVDERSALRYHLTDTLEQISAAARSFRSMADYFERHPEALLRGKGKEGGK